MVADDSRSFKLEVRLFGDGHNACAAYTYDGALVGKVKYDHLWAYTLNNSVLDYFKMPPYYRWDTVEVVLPTGGLTSGGHHKHYILACQSAQLPWELINCCFPSFLTAAYARTCRSVFEGLNKTMTPDVPPKGPYMMGVGVFPRADTGVLKRPITVRINGGPPITLTCW